MKKLSKVLLCITLIFMLCSCGKKRALSIEEASSILENNYFSVSDETSKIDDSTIKTIICANNKKFEINYAIYNKESDAKKIYKLNKENYNLTGKKTGKESKGDNYSKYIQELSDTYNVIIRVDNSIMNISSKIEYKKDIKKIIKNFKY